MVCRWVKINKTGRHMWKRKKVKNPYFRPKVIFAQKQDNLSIAKTDKNLNFNYTNHVSNNSFLFFFIDKTSVSGISKNKIENFKIFDDQNFEMTVNGQISSILVKMGHFWISEKKFFRLQIPGLVNKIRKFCFSHFGFF